MSKKVSWPFFKKNAVWSRVSKTQEGKRITLYYSPVSHKDGFYTKFNTGTAHYEDYETNYKKLIVPQFNSEGHELVRNIGNIPVSDGVTRTINTIDWGHKDTWYQNSLLVTDKNCTADSNYEEYTVDDITTSLINIHSHLLSYPQNSVLKADGTMGSKSDWDFTIKLNSTEVTEGTYIDFINRKIGIFDINTGTSVTNNFYAQFGTKKLYIEGADITSNYTPGSFVLINNYVYKVKTASYDSVKEINEITFTTYLREAACKEAGDIHKYGVTTKCDSSSVVTFTGYYVNPTKGSLWIIRPVAGRMFRLNLAEVNVSNNTILTDYMRMSIFAGDPTYGHYYGTGYEQYRITFRSVQDYINMGNYGATTLLQFSQLENVSQIPWKYSETGIIEIKSSLYMEIVLLLEKDCGFTNSDIATLSVYLEELPE